MPVYPYDLGPSNPGAETGDTTDWTIDSGAATLTATVGGGGSGTSPRTGSYFFWAGNGNFGEAHQDLVIDSDYWDDIDDGLVFLNAGGYHAGSTDDDGGFLGFRFLDGTGRRIAQHAHQGFVSGAPNTWVLRGGGQIFVPPGTRTIRFQMFGVRVSGTSLDSYWDDLFASLDLLTGDVQQRSTGLLYEDNFQYKNAALTTPWTVISGGLHWQQVDELWPNFFSYLRCEPTASAERAMYLDHDALGPGVFQAQMRVEIASTFPHLMVRTDADGENGYAIRLVPGTGVELYKQVGGTLTLLATGTGTVVTGTTYEVKVLIDDDVQKVWLEGSLVIDHDDATYNGETGWAGCLATRTGSGGRRCRWDEFRVMTSNDVTMNGLPTGYKLRVNGPIQDGVSDTAFEATESSGTAVVDCGNLWFPGNSVQVLNGGGDVVRTLTDLIFGGDVFVYDTPASFPPLAPGLTLEGGPGSAQFTTTTFAPNPGDPTDTHQSTKYQLDDTDDTFGSLVVDLDLGDPNLLDYLATGLAAGTYYGRVAHVGETEDGAWSETVTVEVGAAVTIGDTPSLHAVDETQDSITVSIDPYANDDGAVEPPGPDDTVDPDHPYLVYSEIQIRLASSPNWNPENILESQIVAYIGGDLEASFEGRASGTSHTLRGRQFDSRGAFTAWSADLVRSTDAAPGDAPSEPTITGVTCGRTIVITGSAYSGVDAHSGTRVRLCYEGECQVINYPSPVTTVTLTGMPEGSLTVELAYQDTESEWSTYSDPEECEVPPLPPYIVYLEPAHGAVVSASTPVVWRDVTGFNYDIQASSDGDNWTAVATNQVAASTTFAVSGKANGTYYLRVRARNATTAETGEWNVLPIELDRTGVRAFHVHFADYESNADMLADGWVQIGDGPEHLTFTLRSEYDPADDATYMLGVEAQNVHTGTSLRRAGFVNTRWGQPDEFEITAAFEHIPNGCSYYPYRGANPQPTRGGLLARAAADGLNGRYALQSWSTAWYLGPNMQCVSDGFQDHAAAYSAKYSNLPGNTDQDFTYLRGQQPGRLYRVIDREATGTLQTTSVSLTSTTDDRVGGGYFYFDEDNVLGRDRMIGTMRESWRRGVNEASEVGWFVTTRIFAPGADLEASTVFVRELDTIGGTFPGGKLLACGYVGIGFEDIDRQGVGRSEGIIFTDFSLRVISYGSCEAPLTPVGCQADWRLTTFKPDDVTPQHGLYDGDYLTGRVLEGDYHDNRDCPRPFLLPHRDFSETSIDFPSGSADLGQIRVGIVDKRLTSDQNTGIFTSIKDDYIGRRALYERWREDLGYVTVMDGVIDTVELDQSAAAFWLTIRDPRERERTTELFGRNETHALYPDDGPIEAYGVMPNDAGYLIPPAQPQNAAEWDGRGSDPGGDDGVHWGIAILSERSDVYKQDRLYPHGFAALNSETGKYEFRDITVRWRFSVGGEWHYLRNMPSAFIAAGDQLVKNAIIPPAPGGDGIWRLFMSSYDTADLPTTATFIDLQVLAVRTSEETPFWWDRGTLGDLALEILAGEHSESPPSMRYSEAAFAEWALSTPRARFKATEPEKDGRAWMEKNIYAAFEHAPSFDEMMRTIPVAWELPPADEELVELDGDWLIPAGEFSEATSSVYNDVSYTYIQESLLPGFDFDSYQRFIDSLPARDRDRIAAETKPEDFSPWERLLEDKITRRYILQASVDLFGSKSIEYEPTTIRTMATIGEALLTALGADTAQNISDRIGNDVLSRFGWGAAEFYVGIRSGVAHGPGFDPYTLDLRVGQWVKVRASWLPNYVTGERSTYRYMQIKSLTDPEINYRRLRLIDGGPVLEESVTGESDDPDVLPFLEPPSFDYLSETEDLRVEITVVFPPDPPAGYKVRVDYAVSATEPASTSGLWIPLGYLSTEGTILTPVLPAGSTVWIRARGEAAGRRPSAWTPAESVVLTDLPALLSVGLSLVSGGGGLVQLEWVPNAFAGGLEIEVSTGPIGHTPTYGPFDEVDASTSPINLIGEEITYDEELYARVTAWETFSLGSVGGAEGVEYILKVKRPSPADTATHEWGAHTDTRFGPPEGRTDATAGVWDTYEQAWVEKEIASVPLAVGDIDIAGTPDGTKFLRDDGAWATPPAGGAGIGVALTSSSPGTASNSDAVVPFDAATFDDASFWSGGSPNRLTIPSDGLYTVYASSGITTSTTGNRFYIFVRKGGSTQIGPTAQGNRQPTTNVAVMALVSFPHRFTAGEYIELMDNSLQTSQARVSTYCMLALVRHGS